MTVGQNESIAASPVGVCWVVLHDAAVQHVGQWGQRHRRALMATLGRQRRIHCQAANHGDGQAILLARQTNRHG